MSLLTDYDLTQNADYIKRVTSALWKYIQAIAQEASIDGGIQDIKRKSLVDSFVNDLEGARSRIVTTCVALTLTNLTIAAASDDPDPNATITDGDIEFVVTTLVNTLAGINSNNLNV